jgi:hypothetical protein
MSRPLIITLSSPRHPREIRGWHDGSRAGFSTDRRRAKPFHTRREARMALEDLRRQFPRQAIEAQAMVVTDRAAHITHTRFGQRMVGFVAVLALTGGLAGCSQQPLSGSDYLLTFGRLEATDRPGRAGSAWIHPLDPNRSQVRSVVGLSNPTNPTDPPLGHGT